MTSIQTNSQYTLRELGQFNEPVEVRDDEGKLLGLYVPANRASDGGLPSVQPSAAELEEFERRLNEKGRRFTTREVFEHLATLPQSAEDLAHLRRIIKEVEARDLCDSR